MNDIISTHDGSHSLYSNKYKATYHSHFGAIDESITVFLSAGFDYRVKSIGGDTIRILEMGFGTGLNTLLTSIQAERLKQDVIYHTLESDPVPKENWSNLNYGKLLNKPINFTKIHDSKWNADSLIHKYFTLKKFNTLIEDHKLLQEYYDVIYYDAFAPSCQPDLWTQGIHQAIYQSLRKDGVFVTYCAQGKFKRLLKEIGYQLESLPGPAKKKEMTRAIKR